MSDHEKESVKKPLQTLQPTATSENLVGRTLLNLKQQPTQNTSDLDIKKKVVEAILEKEGVGTVHKETQVNFTNQITEDDLTNPDGASLTYWKTLAKKREQTINELQEDKYKLLKRIDDLETDLARHRQMLEEANSFIEVFQEELAKQDDDTGIDVNDISTNEDVTEDDTKTN